MTRIVFSLFEPEWPTETDRRPPLGCYPVTESVCAPASTEGGQMSKVSSFNFREWLVPPVLLPIFLVLLIVAAMLYNTSPA